MKTKKRNAVLAFLLAMNLTGCSLFEGAYDVLDEDRTKKNESNEEAKAGEKETSEENEKQEQKKSVKETSEKDNVEVIVDDYRTANNDTPLKPHEDTNEVPKMVNTNFSTLRELLHKTLDRNITMYTPNSQDVLKSAIRNAQKVLNNQNSPQTRVDEQVMSLLTAMQKLTRVADINELQSELYKAYQINKAYYTPLSYGKLRYLIAAGECCASNKNSSQTMVDELCADIKQAVQSLVRRANTEQLTNSIQRAELLDSNMYTDASFARMNSSLNSAKIVISNLDVTQAMVNSMVKQLNESITSLIVYVRPNCNTLQELLRQGQSYKEEEYSKESFSLLQKAIENASSTLSIKKVTEEQVKIAETKVRDAINALTVDKTQLRELLRFAKEHKEINYTLNSFAVLEAAIRNSETFINAEHTQKEVMEEINRLHDAVEQLVVFVEVDKVKLRSAIYDATQLDESRYTPTSFVQLTAALNSARVVSDTYRATPSDVHKAIMAIETAISSLVQRADVTTLQAIITEAKMQYTGAFTSGSLQQLKTIVEQAESYLNNYNSTQTDINSQVKEVRLALGSLLPLGDKTALATLIHEVDNLKEEDYTSLSWVSASIGSTIENAQNIQNKEEATQQEVSDAMDMLIVAKSKLVKVVDINALSNEIVKAQAEIVKGYTEVTKNNVKEALSKAQVVIESTNVTSSEIKTALTTLKNAIAELKVDNTPLRNEIKNALAIDTTNKLPSTVTTLWDAIEDAQAYKDSLYITFEGMNERIQSLKDAVSGLLDKTDTSVLTAKVNEAKALNKELYTDASYMKLSKVVVEVEQALLNENITMDQVTQFVTKLETAVNELVLNPTVASKRKECEQLIVQGKALLNDPLLQAPAEYRTALKDEVEFVESTLASYTDDEFTVDEIQGYIDNINVVLKDFNDNLYDVQGLILQCRAKIAEARAMDTTGFSENSVYSMNYYADHLEESIANGQTYAYLQSAYDWLIEAINDLAPADTTVYVNEKAPGEVLTLLNAERKKLGLIELVMDSKLCEATTIRATEAKDQIGAFVDWAHKRPDGRKWSTVLDEIGYHQSYAGENAASAFASGNAVYNAWYASQGHKDNMLDSHFTKVGISMVKVGEGQWVSYMILA